MNIALIGYGKMGKTIEQIALQRGHVISAIVDISTEKKIDSKLKEISDVAIEFSVPQSAEQNINSCLLNGLSVVSGTTGWKADLEKINSMCEKYNVSFFHARNFSIGVNIFNEINKKLAILLNDFNEYNCRIEETHHIHKLDKPSGTAILLAENIIENNEKYVNWKLKSESDISNLEINSFREGEVFGDHKIIWESEIDSISLTHSAKNRRGFALGAVLAAELIFNKKGIYTMQNLLNL
jgi:4-hydroxy-tetrahydrodipicolinate reductase